MTVRSISKTVTVRLSDFNTADLLNELRERGHENAERLAIPVILEGLRLLGCPRDIQVSILDWDNQPITTAIDLRKWIETCNSEKGA